MFDTVNGPPNAVMRHTMASPRAAAARSIATRVRVPLLALMAAVLAGAPISAQQQSATIRGIVVLPDGQPADDAAVALLDQLGFEVAATRTAPNGRFALEQVSPGTYTVLADAPPQRSEARIVTVHAALAIDVELRLTPRLDETVTVRADAEGPSVTTRMTIAGDAVRLLPSRLPSRAVQQLLSTLPGWAGEDNGLLHVRGVDDGFLYVEDGVPVYDRLDAQFGIAPDPLSVGRMNVLTGYIPPQYGLKSGAVIEVQSATGRPAGWSATFDAGGGSDALGTARTAAGGPLGSRTSLGVSVAAERSGRFLDPVHPGNFHNDGGVFSAGAHLAVTASSRDLVRINLGGGRALYDVPHGEVAEEAGQDQRQRILQNSLSGSWQRFWSGDVVSQVAIHRRDIRGDLRDSPNDIPLSAASSRRHERLGLLAGLTYHRGRHTAKIGVEASRLELFEDFRFAVTDPEEAEEAEISDGAAAFTPDDPFHFRDSADRMGWSFYVQDRVRATDRVTLDFGVRFDRTNLLVPASQWSPRVGAAYSLPGGATTVRASVNRLFQPPQPEHLLLSSSAAARALSPFVDQADVGDGSGGAELPPERQTAWEVGVDRWLGGGRARFDVAYWSRHVRNYADPNVFFGTTIIFPNSVARGRARGLDVRFEVPRHGGWSGYASYTLSDVVQIGPINGGLFLEDSILEIGPGTRFTPDHDQRHVAAAGVTYVNGARGFTASFTAQYASGTPLEVEEDELDELMERPGAHLVDFDRVRVRPRTVFDAAVSQNLFRGRRARASIWLGVLNLTNREYALNFGNPFSGTHFGAPRTVRVELRIGLR